MNKEIIICVGISGSGKSTWTTNFIKNNHNYLRINRDDIRKTLVGDLEDYYQRKDLNNIELKINSLEYEIFDSLINKYKLIIDNTNLKQKYINKWMTLCFEDSIDFKFKLFDCDLSDAEFRVMNRDLILETNYIDKQFKDYQEIKKWILKTYPDKIL